MPEITYGMVGGGPGAMIGQAHRRAVRLDGLAVLKAGCFSRTPEKSKDFGKELGLESNRCYANYREMAVMEGNRKDGIDFVVVVTPNNSHYEICRMFLEAGIHVVCDKPLTTHKQQAMELMELAARKNLLFMVTYTYTGNVTFKYMRDLIRKGEIGTIRTVMAEYPQGWLYNEKDDGGKQGAWRMDPAYSGRVNCLGDLGTHVENAVAAATGLKIRRVLAKLDTVVPGRRLDDNDQVLLEYDNGATGVYWTSQFAIGSDNGLRLRVYGSQGTILWFQEESEKLILIKEDGIPRIIKRGYPAVTASAARYARMPSGHPEGWLESMGNLYDSFISCILAQKEGNFTKDMIDYPTAEDGFRGIRYVEACLKSHENGNVWVDIQSM